MSAPNDAAIVAHARKPRSASSPRSRSASRPSPRACSDERRDEPDAEDERADRHRVDAAARGRAREAVGQQRQSGREQQEPAHVQAPARQALLVRHDPQPEHERDEAERHVDEEQPAPGHLADQQAAEDRARASGH